MPTAPRPESSAVVGISTWFFLNGLVIASWIAHVPRLKRELDAAYGPLSVTFFCFPFGAAVGTVSAPWVARRLGAARAARLSGFIFSLLLQLPLLSTSLVGLGAALFAFGTMNGVLGVTMNAAAAAAELRLGRPVMSSFHGWFSTGMVVGGVCGLLALAAGLHPAVHAGLVGLMSAAVLVSFRPVGGEHPQAEARTRSADRRPGDAAGRRRQIVVLAWLTFVCFFLEGAMADWAGLLAARFGAAESIAPLAYVAYTVTWAGGRLIGDRLSGVVGDAVLVGAGGGLAGVGLAAGISSGSPLGVAVGSAAVGLGLANVVPVLFRRAARLDVTGQGRGLAVVSGLGSVAFLVGPSAVGFAADAVTLPVSMTAAVLLGGGILAAGARVLRAPAPGTPLSGATGPRKTGSTPGPAAPETRPSSPAPPG